jgi:hypothetical protein
MKVLREAIKRLDADKPYWQKLSKSLKGRYSAVVENGVELLRN